MKPTIALAFGFSSPVPRTISTSPRGWPKKRVSISGCVDVTGVLDNEFKSTMNAEGHLNIGAMIFPEIDQLDFTGPFEVLSRLPNSTFHILWKERVPVRDIRGLI